MDDFYRLDRPPAPPISCSSNDDMVRVENFSTHEFHNNPVDSLLQFDHRHHHRHHQEADHHHHNHHTQVSTGSSDMFELIKTQIANHPRYPELLSAHIDCQKVGAPPEMASLLEEIGRENENYPINTCRDIGGADPELDEFMESYCEVLHRYKEELSKPFDEATTFLTSIESQLSDLCKGTLTRSSFDFGSDEAAGTSEEEVSCGEGEASESQELSGGGCPRGQDLKGMLLRKYSGYLVNLRKEFLKKRTKGKLPKDARTTLIEWWNNHNKWPYPTEEEKVKLSELTGLDQKQINNWFINQRKRHWKPSEDMRFALMEGVSSCIIGPPTYFDTGGGARGEDV